MKALTSRVFFLAVEWRKASSCTVYRFGGLVQSRRLGALEVEGLGGLRGLRPRALGLSSGKCWTWPLNPLSHKPPLKKPDMGVSENYEYLILGPYNKDPTI